MTPADILLTGQAALVTGGASGIGKGIALGLAAFGADVAIADIYGAAAEAAAAEIRALGRRALALPTDVLDRDQLRAAIDRTAAEFGRLDILVNNAGGVRQIPFLAQSERSRDRHVEFNLGSLLTAVHHGAQVMVAQGKGGSIINIASIEGLRGAPGFAVYAACKAAMINLTRTTAVELAHHGIRVNAIAPDIVITEGFAAFAPDSLEAPQVEARARYIPLGRDGTPEDCAGTAVFLASPMAAYVTGTTISVDGGTWASSGWTRTGDETWTLTPAPAPELKP